MSESIFGSITSTIDVEEATLETLRIWIPEWLSEVERQKGKQRGYLNRPPDPESYHGGDDFDSWKEDDCPEYIVVVKADSLERNASAGYTVAYNVDIACVLIQQDEEEARTQISLHGAALMFLVQQATLGGLAERLVMTKAPTPEFPDPTNRRLARAIASFTVWVASVVNENLGPVQPNPKESPEYEGKEEAWADEPIVEKVEETIKAAAPWLEGREYTVGENVQEAGVFYEAIKLQLASEVHRPSLDVAREYWKVV